MWEKEVNSIWFITMWKFQWNILLWIMSVMSENKPQEKLHFQSDEKRLNFLHFQNDVHSLNWLVYNCQNSTLLDIIFFRCISTSRFSFVYPIGKLCIEINCICKFGYKNRGWHQRKNMFSSFTPIYLFVIVKRIVKQ